jgi:hypothetical protein
MDDLVPIQPDESAKEKQHKHERDKSKRAKFHTVYDVQKCLEALSQLPGLLMMGYVRPAQANAIRSTLETLLRHYRQTDSTRSESALQDIDIMSILRTHPELVSLFESLLTDEQLEAVMKEAKDGDDRET